MLTRGKYTFKVSYFNNDRNRWGN